MRLRGVQVCGQAAPFLHGHAGTHIWHKARHEVMLHISPELLRAVDEHPAHKLRSHHANTRARSHMFAIVKLKHLPNHAWIRMPDQCRVAWASLAKRCQLAGPLLHAHQQQAKAMEEGGMQRPGQLVGIELRYACPLLCPRLRLSVRLPCFCIRLITASIP